MAGLFFRRSLAQDDMDRYNTWAVLFLSLLALVFLFVPFSFNLDSSVKSEQSETGSNKMAPKVKAICWLPAQFEDAHVRYADAFCNQQANRMLNGMNTTGRVISAVDTLSTVDSRSAISQTDLSFTEAFVKQNVEELERQEEQLARSDQVGKKIQEFVNFRTPVVLFLLALCLKLPYIFWSLLKNMKASCINIDQTLESCAASRLLDVANQRETHDLTATEVAKSIGQSRSTASVLYLFFKLSTFLVVFVGIIFISQFIIPDIQAMENDFVTENPLNETKSSFASLDVFQCFFQIRAFSRVHNYTVPCLLAGVEEPAAVTNDASDVNQSKVLMYQALFTIVLALLATLVIANIFNTVSWFLRLTVSSYATSMGLPSNAAMDVVLLTHMAWLNVGPVVARGLADSSVWSSKIEETDTEPMIESKA